MTPPIVRFEEVSKLYRRGVRRVHLRAGLPGRLGESIPRDAVRALDEVSFEVAEGESLGIIGPNGAGKSTLLKLLAQVTRPTRGRVCARGRVASLIELGLGFHPDLTGAENLRYTAALLGMTRAEVERKYSEIVEFAGIEAFMDTPVKWFSSGMHARLGFAVASHMNADILAVDEVLAVGDAAFQLRCYERLKSMRADGVSVVFVSHDLWLTAQVCDRIIHLERGRVVDEGGPGEVTDRYAGPGAASGRVWGASPVRIHDLAIAPQGIQPGEGFEVAARLEVREPRPEASVELSLLRPEGYVFARARVEEARRALDEPGTWELHGVIESLPITSGTYLVALSVLDGPGEAPLARSTREVAVIGPVASEGRLAVVTRWSVSPRVAETGLDPILEPSRPMSQPSIRSGRRE